MTGRHHARRVRARRAVVTIVGLVAITVLSFVLLPAVANGPGGATTTRSATACSTPTGTPSRFTPIPITTCWSAPPRSCASARIPPTFRPSRSRSLGHLHLTSAPAAAAHASAMDTPASNVSSSALSGAS